jgi:hypothetical protein
MLALLVTVRAQSRRHGPGGKRRGGFFTMWKGDLEGRARIWRGSARASSFGARHLAPPSIPDSALKSAADGNSRRPLSAALRIPYYSVSSKTHFGQIGVFWFRRLR